MSSGTSPEIARISVCFSADAVASAMLVRDRNSAVNVRECRVLRRPASTSPIVIPSKTIASETVLQTAKQLLLRSSKEIAPSVDPLQTSVPSFVTDKRASSSSAPPPSSVDGIPGLVTTVTIPEEASPEIDSIFPVASITVVMLAAAAVATRLQSTSSRTGVLWRMVVVIGRGIIGYL